MSNTKDLEVFRIRLDSVREFAKCGIHHNHSYNEEKLKFHLATLDAVVNQIDELCAERFRISELEAENKRLREALIEAKEDAAALIEQHRWIPVTERLPEDEGIYLVLCPKYVADPIVVRWNNKVWFDNEVGLDITDHVTHWIAIPQPPKEQ